MMFYFKRSENYQKAKPKVQKKINFIQVNLESQKFDL